MDSFSDAIELQPDLMKAHIELGTTLVSLGRMDEAIAAYRRAIEIRPYFAILHHNLGLALREAGQEEEAQRELEKARSRGYKPPE
jgi:tetratricopeptide (TPR) repeat protein